MGLFLQTAIFPGSDISDVQTAVEQAAREQGIHLDLKACLYAQSVEGTQVLLEGELGFEGLAEELSRICCGPVMLLYIYDGDFWGYDYYFAGKEVDHFSSCPDYFGADEGQQKRLAGNPSALVGDFPIYRPEAVNRYFPFYLGAKPDEESFAYPGDQYPYGDCWQMTDFMARLGFPWAFDSKNLDGPSGPPPLPTLEEILEQHIPPQSYNWDGAFPLAGNLTTALSRDYIRSILGQKGFETYARKTPREIMAAREEAKLAFGRRLTCEYVEPRLCILSAFCALWLGNPDRAFWELYEAVGNGTDNVELLRARGMAVPLFNKRHIAINDLSRLMELDPANRDVYLLCRAYFNGMLGQKVEKSKEDLAALAGLGTLRQDDPRLNFSAFDSEFLKDPESFFRREEEQDRKRLKSLTEQLDEKKRLTEEKEARRLRLILEKRRKKKGGQ